MKNSHKGQFGFSDRKRGKSRRFYTACFLHLVSTQTHWNISTVKRSAASNRFTVSKSDKRIVIGLYLKYGLFFFFTFSLLFMFRRKYVRKLKLLKKKKNASMGNVAFVFYPAFIQWSTQQSGAAWLYGISEPETICLFHITPRIHPDEFGPGRRIRTVLFLTRSTISIFSLSLCLSHSLWLCLNLRNARAVKKKPWTNTKNEPPPTHHFLVLCISI